MGRITLVLGGARSGKSAFAERLASTHEQVAYFATAECGDEEMAKRIERHQADRPDHWMTIESPLNLSESFAVRARGCSVAIIDCLTLYVSNLFEAGKSLDDILAEAGALAAACRRFEGDTIIVSNEVGFGLVPANELARAYRDALGVFNQVIAAEADTVYLMAAGIPLKIKGLKG